MTTTTPAPPTTPGDDLAPGVRPHRLGLAPGVLERVPRATPTRRVLLAGGLVALGVVLALLTSVEPYLTVGVGLVVLVVGLTLREPLALPILGMPLLLLVNRVGGALSLSDFVLFVGFWPALLFCRRPLSRPMRHVLWASAFYQATVLFTVIANPYVANVVEWFHSWLLVGGALLVGWAIGAAGKARLALGLFVAGAVVVALFALAQFVVNLASGNTGPVYLNEPLMMHKNYIGCVLAFAAIIVYTRPRWLRWNDLVCLGLFGLFLAGILVAQSRQALIGLAVAVAIVALRPDPHRHRSKVVLVAIAGAAVVVGTLVQDQLESGDQYNSAYQRLTWFAQSVEIWQQYPWFGAGLRWWYTDRFTESFQPPNAEFEMLSSGGLVGLVGFLLMFLVILVVLWRVDPRYGTLAFVMVLMRFVQGQFDLFWVAAQVSIPFVIAGICLGAHAYAARSGAGDDGLPRTVAAPAGPVREPGPADSAAGRRARHAQPDRPRRRRLPLPIGHKEHA
ncbi:O-antigen ligase family protein [Cellulomonas triticagri]|uniref:O-antigen ligase domain-containing protein n=1 Tax=Cellulomonas triticagri TaxID=2483352 RepID=A0A3M2INK8_9CELL|nr:O-antigen ligase family protein [Cellulomonas triticagri]RMI03502.1 O-antigen ligase domain-containing protein [Cellulomonas triticagri]